MTNEEAIKRLIDQECRFCNDIPSNCEVIDCEIKVAIEALEKQIPKKPTIQDGHCYCPNKCPSATKDTLYWTVGKGEDYCDRCGQRLLWEDSNGNDA